MPAADAQRLSPNVREAGAGRQRTAPASPSHVTGVPGVPQGDASPAQPQWLRRDPLSKRPRVAGVYTHETLHSALPLSGAGHHGVCARADGRVRTWGGGGEGGAGHGELRGG